MGLYILWAQPFARATVEPGPNCVMELPLVGLPRATFSDSASGTACIARPVWGSEKLGCLSHTWPWHGTQTPRQ